MPTSDSDSILIVLFGDQAKLRDARGSSSSGWRLDPYKERNVAGNGNRKKKSA
jgi:hypothetical protein